MLTGKTGLNQWRVQLTWNNRVNANFLWCVLDSDDARYMGRKNHSECAYAGVGVNEDVTGAEVKPIANEFDQALGLSCVGLEEGSSGDAEAVTEELFVVELLAGWNRGIDLAEVRVDKHLAGVDAETESDPASSSR